VGTGAYKLVEGISTLNQRSDRLVLEANLDYWDTTRSPRLRRIVFDNTLQQQDAVELVKSGEGRVDLVTGLSPLETLRVAQSPFAQIVKTRGSLASVLGLFNMRKAGSPCQDMRLRQAVNLAINREDLIRYAAKGNGVTIPALVPAQGFGHHPTLTPYPFDAGKTRQLLQEAGHPDGLPLTLMATNDLEVQATVVSKMLQQAGFQVALQILDPAAYDRQTLMSHLERAPEQHTWDIALMTHLDIQNFPVFNLYHWFALDGPYDWVQEQPNLRQFYEQALRTVDRDRQQPLIRQMERHTREHFYFLFLYNPIQLYAMNKAVTFLPYATTRLILTETSVTDQHWSVRRVTTVKE
jgi:glutathione transport system substrate-binding protein